MLFLLGMGMTLGSVLNQNVLNGAHLSAISTGIGMVMGLIIFYFRYNHNKNKSVLAGNKYLPWMQSMPHHMLTFFLCIFTSLFSFHWINNHEAFSSQVTSTYQVIKTTEHGHGSKRKQTLLLENGQKRLTISRDISESYAPGEQIEITIKTGHLGYQHMTAFIRVDQKS